MIDKQQNNLYNLPGKLKFRVSSLSTFVPVSPQILVLSTTSVYALWEIQFAKTLNFKY